MSGHGENPFSEPEDDDHTLIVPREAFSALAARRAAQGAGVAEPPAGTGAARMPGTGEAAQFTGLPPVGRDPILVAAQPLLALMARLRNVVSVPDPGALRERTVVELRRFEASLREAKVPPEHLRLAHYALCTSLDDVVQCTPWGSHGPWAQISLSSAFHKDTRGGERFFEILRKLVASPARYVALIELMYLCMSLGMHGQFRLSPRGPAELDRLRQDTYAVLRSQLGTPPVELSPRWQGLAAPFRPLRFEMPLWLAALIGLGVLALAYGFVSLGLGGGTDRVFASAGTLPPTGMPVLERAGPAAPPPVVPEKPALRSRLISELAPDIAKGLLSVGGTEFVPILRLQSDGMFAVGQAKIETRSLSAMQHIADALGGIGDARIRVIGYTDGQPIHTLAFPSNYELSLARAHAAADVLASRVPPSRITVQGKGAEDPRTSNATADGRRANRRVEIVVETTGAG